MSFIKKTLENRNYEPLAAKTAKATIYIFRYIFLYII